MAKPVDPAASGTLNYQWMKPGVASSPDVWGNDLNWDLDQIDSTMWSVSAAQSGYLPLTGGALTGGLNGTSASFSAQIAAGSSVLACTASVAGFGLLVTGGTVPVFQWATNVYEQYQTGVWSRHTGGTQVWTLDGGGNSVISGFLTANGWYGRQGSGGALSAQVNNFNWTGSALQLWIGAVNAGAITVTSDYRVKKDIQLLGSTWDQVKALKPISFTFKDYTPAIELERDADALPLIVGSDEEHWGFIAHELQETLIPSAASGVKDQADCIQSPNPWTVIATLTKALQEAMARIEALEAR